MGFPGLSSEVSVTTSSRAAVFPILRRQKLRRDAERCLSHSANKLLLRLSLAATGEPRRAWEKLSTLRELRGNLRRHCSLTTRPEALRFLELFKGLCYLRPKPVLMRGASRCPERQPGSGSPLPPRKLPRPTHPRSSKPRSLKAESARLLKRSGAMFAFWRHSRGSSPFPAPPPSRPRPCHGPAGEQRDLSLTLLLCSGEGCSSSSLTGCIPGQYGLPEETTLHYFVAQRLKDERNLPWYLVGGVLPLSQVHH